MNNRKNVYIGVLAAALLVTSIWGQIESRRRKELEAKGGAATHQPKSAARDLEMELKDEARSRQAAAQLEQVKQELEALRKRNAELEAKAAAPAAEVKTAEQQEKVDKLQKQVVQQQAVLEEQEQKLAAASKAGQEQANVSQEAQARLNEALAKLQAAEGQLAQLQEKQGAAEAEAEAMRAQVIGLEKMVEERGAAFAGAAKELENCKLNTNILIAKIAEQTKQEQGCRAEQPVKFEDKGAALPADQSAQILQEQQMQR